MSVCGVDPATRGPRMDEGLTIVRQLLTGSPVTFHGAFFDLDEALILPAPAAPIPIIIGGRSDAAIRRAALGDVVARHLELPPAFRCRRRDGQADGRRARR